MIDVVRLTRNERDVLAAALHVYDATLITILDTSKNAMGIASAEWQHYLAQAMLADLRQA